VTFGGSSVFQTLAEYLNGLYGGLASPSLVADLGIDARQVDAQTVVVSQRQGYAPLAFSKPTSSTAFAFSTFETYNGQSEIATLTNTTFDGFSGWLDFVVVDAAIRALEKEESDPSALMAERARIEKRIEAMAENRDAGSPPTVADVYRTGGDWPGGEGYR
jgi:hypothetical protein